MAIMNFFPGGGGSGKDISGATVTLGTALEYNGSVQTQTVSSVVLNGVTLTPDTDYVVIGNTGTDVGSYQLTVLGIGNYGGFVTAAWSISKKTVAKPSVSGSSFTYDGSAKGPTITGFDSTYMTKTGDSATNAGDYTLVISLIDANNCEWEDDSITPITQSWSIAKATPTVTAPTAKTGLTYNGSAKALVNAGSTTGGELQYSLDGTSYSTAIPTRTNAGTYTVHYKVVGNANYNDVAANSVSVTIAKVALTKPTISSGTFTYSPNTTRTPTTDANYDSTTMSKSGDTSAVNAGNYTLTVSLRDTDNYEWADHTTAALSLAWTINKATGSISVNPTSLSLFGLNTTGTATITKTGDGTVAASSNATSKATASVSGNTVTVTAKGSGSATITVTLAEGDNYLGASATISVSTVVPDSTLANNTPAVIQAAAQAGVAASTWSVGDTTAAIAFQNKTVGALSFNSLSACAFIIGFDHNSSVEGTGIHFQFGKTTHGTDIAFVDSDYGNTGSSAAFRMNTTNTNVGGWKSSYMRSTICPAFLTALPSAWQNVIASTTKYTDNTGNSSMAAANVTSTSDKIFLLNEQEVFGTTSRANTNEANKTAQYAYYANGNSKIKYKHSATTAACDWWLRSPRSSSAAVFVVVYTDGTVGSYGAYYSFGFAPGFKVA